jgi:sugar (pentulose or hexulose) kinase
MAEELVIGIDCSTTAVKAIAWSPAGQAVAEGRAAFPMLRPNPGWYEQDANLWWQGTCSALRDLTAKIDLTRLAGLCITHQRESFVPVDRQGQPLRNAMLWLDARSHAQVQRLAQQFGWQSIRELTGKPPSMTPALPKILWLMENEPEISRAAALYLDTHAFLIHRLTGEYRTSLASADPLGIVDMRAGRWAQDLLDPLGLRETQLPELIPAGAFIGRVCLEAAVQTGLPAGLPLTAGGGDGQFAGLGVGTVEPGEAYLNLGTAVVSGVLSPAYRTDEAFRTLNAPWGGGFYLETLLRGGVFLVNWFIDAFAGDLRGKAGKSAEELLEAEAEKIPPGSLGLMLVPYWVGAMNPYWDMGATGITLGWTGDHRREHLYRAMLEGVAFEQRLASAGAEAALGQSIRAYRTLGGGSRSRLWCQLFADITGIPVERSGVVEATCLGAGILAAVSAGWYASVPQAAAAMTSIQDRFTPQAERQAIYDRLFREVYQEVFPTLRQLVDRLSELTTQS